MLKKKKIYKLKAKRSPDPVGEQRELTPEEEVKALEEGIAAEQAELAAKSGQLPSPRPAIPEELRKDAKKYIPFSYINGENLKRLIICLTRENSPKIIALVVSYLKTEYVREVLNSLPQATQAMVAVEMATIHQMGQSQVMEIDKDIKGKVGFLVGGLDHLLKVLDQVDPFTRDNILNSLRGEQPELYAKVRKQIVLFEDIPSFPDQAMQVITRTLKSDSLARALRNADPEITNKFFANMSSNAAVVLKEEMEYGRQLTETEISEEREKIVNLIKEMEKDGKVFIREKPKGMMLDGIQEEQSDAKGFQEYYDAGARCYEEGRYEDAVTFFEYCVNMDPGNAGAFQYLGSAQYALGRTDEALASYRKALELDPSNEELKNWIEQNG